MHAAPNRFARRMLLQRAQAVSPRTERCLCLSRQAMACLFEVMVPQDAVADLSPVSDALREVERIEGVLSVFRDSSEIAAINRCAANAGAASASDEVFALLDRCRDLHAATDGAFDITTTPFSRCWGFLQRDARVPDIRDIERARHDVGMSRLILEHATLSVRFVAPGMALNLGAIGKGYALDRMGGMLRREGVADALLSAGASSLLAIGGGRSGWTIDVTSPRRPERLARIHLRDGALGTSGAGEQFIMVDGRRYGHVIDPRTGWPASEVLSASVVADSAETADALSTAFLVGGATLAHRYCGDHPNTLALITPEATPDRTYVIGSHRSARLEN